MTAAALHRRRRSGRTACCVALALALLLAPLLGGCSKAQEAKPTLEPAVAGEEITFPDHKDPLGVRLASVGNNVARTLTVPGRLTWDEDHTTRVFAPYAGRIERLRVAVGQSVQRGQPLADIASADIGQAQADLHKAQADLVVARAALERARDLSEGGVIARKDLLQAEADQARAQAEAARTRARVAQYGVAADGVTQGLLLTAPLGGVVVERNANPGTEVRADVQGPPLFTISDPSSLSALLDVDETQLSAFKVGDALMLHCAAWPDLEFKAIVTSVAAAVDPASRTVKVRARVPNPQLRLKAEMFVTATALQPIALPMVPADAVFLRGEASYVFLQLAPGRYQRQQVQVRSAGPQEWMVLQGVNPGQTVVVGGGLYLNQLIEAAR